ncbi:MAG: acetyl ornithine aminotransferase family protein [Acidobacteriaceae bacterium]|nr:acetyl ornithine aminotransferase family protein [Acidobacteriaceae bacterium]MBV9778692.1 acetyl ornithine aminotransferase family protein [Acidobacteriaceae bacterium]
MLKQIAVDSLLPNLVTSLPGPRAKQIIERDRAVLSPSYTRCYPLVVRRGEGAIVEDVDGNHFLDFNAGIAVVATGHSHPRVVSAIQKQAAEFLHMSGTDFYYEGLVRLAEKLAALTPGGLDRRVYFGNSGAEAIEAAIKMARYHSGRDKFIAFLGGFHGRTMGALSLTGSKVVQRRGFHPMLPVHHIPFPYCYRCPYSKDPSTCDVECVKVLEDQLFKTILPAEEVAAIVVEPVQGEGGYLVPPAKFHQELRRIADKYGILLIHDEVQCGMGRTGRMFASEHFGVTPDIVTLAKGLASGMPLGATVARADVMNWGPGAHASTFGGNPVSIAASLTTIELLEDGLIANAAELGAYMLDRMKSWPRRFKYVGDVRGLGLMIGFEMVYDQQTKERAPHLRDQLEMMAFERGLLTLGAGPNSIRLCPPLVITREQADFAIDTLEQCLQAQQR